MRTHLAAALVSVAPLRSALQRQLHRPPRLSVRIGRQRTDRDQEAIGIGLRSVRIGGALEQHAGVTLRRRQHGTVRRDRAYSGRGGGEGRGAAHTAYCWFTRIASGSENGTPSSRISTPPLTNAWSAGTVVSIDGSPAVMKETSAVLPSRLYVSSRRPIRLKIESRPCRQWFGYPCPHAPRDLRR